MKPGARSGKRGGRGIMPAEDPMRLAAAAAGIAIAAGAVHAAAPACSAQSPGHTVALVELYTSEGCDSCPPADRWLSSLLARGFTPDRIVPLALHLDARDYTGWKDEDAKVAFAMRRRKLALLRRPALVYTPHVVLQGRDFPDWRGDAFAKSVAEINARPQRAGLGLAIRAIGPAGAEVDITAELAGAAPHEEVVLYAAAYEDKPRATNPGTSCWSRSGSDRSRSAPAGAWPPGAPCRSCRTPIRRARAWQRSCRTAAAPKCCRR
jgi:hypothetical protein